MQNQVVPNREYKSGLFAFLFHDKKALLSLYNAVNESDYADPDELEIYTMEGFIYMGMKNDLSFLIDSQLAVFEHQSSYNPNMPLRGYIYMADALKKYIARNHLDIYSSRRLELPVLRYYVFYNGTRKMEDETVLYLTDSMKGENVPEKSCAQFKACMMNINEGHSRKIMERCPLLYEYSYFVAAVRKYMHGRDSLMEAIEKAVEECIQKGILADLLRAHRAEVTDMLLKEYDEEFHISCEKKISYEDGVQAGRNQEKARADEAVRKGEEEARRADDEARRADNEARRADDEARRADEANQKVNELTQRKNEADQKANEATQRANEAIQNAEILARRLRGCSEAEIAHALHITIEEVKECISKALKKQEDFV